MEIDQSKLTSKQKIVIFGILGILGLAYGSTVLAIAARAAGHLAIIGICTVALAGGALSLPLLKVKMENFVLKRIKAEINKNPIEYLQNDYAAAELSYNEQEDVIAELSETRDVFKNRHKEYQDKHGEEEPTMASSITTIEEVINDLEIALEISKKDLDSFKALVIKESDKYRMAEGLDEATSKAMKAIGKKDAMRPFLRNEALSAAQDKFYGSLSSVKNLAERTHRQLGFTPKGKEKLITQE